MATLNINRNVQDAFYRYKMPKLLAKVEGNGNGIKTVVPNMVEIAKALARPPAYPTKFFGCELGAQVQMDERAERYIVNGNHDQAKLQDLLFGFIDKFVLCNSCGNPETNLKVTKKKTIEQTCVACGHHQLIDTGHKLITYIINHPPNAAPEADSKSKASKSKKGEDGAKKGEEAASIDVAQAAVRANVAERQDGNISAPAAQEQDDDDVDWSEDVSEEAVRQRQAKLGLGVAALTMTADLDRPIEDRLEIFHKFIESRVGKPTFTAKDIVAEAERLDCREKGIMSVVEFLLDDETLLARIDANKGLLVRFTIKCPKAQKYLLNALERVIEKRNLIAKTAHVLKKLYDLDIVEEEAIFAWAEKPSKKYATKENAQKMRDNAAVFIKWLKEAEEESEEEDDEDDEDGVGIGFDSSAAATIVAPKADAKEEEEDDVDIDAIQDC